MLFFVTLLLEQKIKIKSSSNSLYYAEAPNEWRGPSLRLSAWATQLRRNAAAVASRWRHCRFDRSGIESQISRTESVRLATRTKGFKNLNCFFFFRWKHEEVGKLQLHS